MWVIISFLFKHGYTNVIGTEPYLQNYYAGYMNIPYSSQGAVNDVTAPGWSASGTSDSITIISPYPEMNTYEQYGFGFQPAYSFGYTGTGEYASWTGIAAAPQLGAKTVYEEYYPDNRYHLNNSAVINTQDAHVANEHLNKLENNISNLTLSTNITKKVEKKDANSVNEKIKKNNNISKDNNNNNTGNINLIKSNSNNPINSNNDCNGETDKNIADDTSNDRNNGNDNNTTSNDSIGTSNSTDVSDGIATDNSNTETISVSPIKATNNTTSNTLSTTTTTSTTSTIAVVNSHNNKNNINNNNDNHNSSNNANNNNNTSKLKLTATQQKKQLNNKSWASVVSAPTFTPAVQLATNKPYNNQNQALLSSNPANIVGMYTVTESTLISPNGTRQVSAPDIQFYNKNSNPNTILVNNSNTNVVSNEFKNNNINKNYIENNNSNNGSNNSESAINNKLYNNNNNSNKNTNMNVSYKPHTHHNVSHYHPNQFINSNYNYQGIYRPYHHHQQHYNQQNNFPYNNQINYQINSSRNRGSNTQTFNQNYHKANSNLNSTHFNTITLNNSLSTNNNENNNSVYSITVAPTTTTTVATDSTNATKSNATVTNNNNNLKMLTASAGHNSNSYKVNSTNSNKLSSDSITTNNINNDNNNNNDNSSNNNLNNTDDSNAPENNTPGERKSSVLAELRLQNQYNPKDFNLAPKGARFFVIKSYSEDDVHRSIKYNIWCSTEHGNRRLDQAFREREGKGPVYLFFSVNGSGHFCGMAEMMSCVDYDSKSDVWSQDKWKGKFEVKWVYVKDVPNSQLRNIRLENNENKPVTNSRDTQEIPYEKGKQVLKVFHIYRNTTSIFDDFEHYEKRQDEDHKKPLLSIIQ